MNTISLTYPESGLTVNVSVYVKGSSTLDNSGVATETGNTKTYIYEFSGAPLTDYVYVASSAGYQNIGGTIFASESSGGGATVEEIWSAQISDYSGVAGTFATKFEQYGGVSHVIHDSKGAAITIEEKQLIKDNKDLMEKVIKELAKKNTMTPEQMRELSKYITIPTQPIQQFNPQPIINVISSLKSSIDELTKKEIVFPENDDTGTEIIAGVLTEVLPDIGEKLELVFEALGGYEQTIKQLKKENEKYKTLVTELTK